MIIKRVSSDAPGEAEISTLDDTTFASTSSNTYALTLIGADGSVQTLELRRAEKTWRRLVVQPISAAARAADAAAAFQTAQRQYIEPLTPASGWTRMADITRDGKAYHQYREARGALTLIHDYDAATGLLARTQQSGAPSGIYVSYSFLAPSSPEVKYLTETGFMSLVQGYTQVESF